MKILVAAVGQKLPGWADAAVRDYLDRFPRDFRVEVRAIKPEARTGADAVRVQSLEAARLRAGIPPGAHLIAMDETGVDWTTAQFASELRAWRDAARDPVFVIGGADGLDAELKRQATLRLRLSSLTLPHALARVLLVEQLYRAWSILASHPYHRA